MTEAPARRSGLGRGLQALLPHAGEQPPAPDPVDWVAAADGLPARLPPLVESGLDVLESALGIDVCAYVHSAGPGRPRLWLRDGPRAGLASHEWFELGVTAVGLVLGQVRMPRSVEMGSTELLAVPTRGGGSAGVHLLGRSGRSLTDHERTVAIHLVQALGEALHGLLPEQQEAEPPAVEEPPPTPLETTKSPQLPVRVPAQLVTARWPGIDLEELVRDTVQASGIKHSDLDVRLTADRGGDVLDVAAGHRGDRVRVVVPADPDDPANSATKAALQTINLLQLIGAEPAPQVAQLARD